MTKESYDIFAQDVDSQNYLDTMVTADPILTQGPDTVGGAPVMSDSNPQMDASPLQLLGSIGSTARDAGTAAGTVLRDLRGAAGNFNGARDAAESGNSLKTWWLYASMTDKLVVGLGVATLAYMVLKK